MKKLTFTLAIILFTGLTMFAADYYWVGGTGNWNDLSKWATTSGGSTFHTSLPTANDNVFFDANSFTAPGQKVTINVDATCASMNWTGALHEPELAGTTARTIFIHGSLTLIEEMNFSYAGNVRFLAATTGNTISSSGKIFKLNVYFEGVGGYVLQDAFRQTGNTVYFVRGTLDLNHQPFTVNRFNTTYTNVRTLFLRNSDITINGNVGFEFRGENLTLDAGNSIITFTNNAGILHNGPHGPGQAFNIVIFEATAGTSLASNVNGSFNKLIFNNHGSITGGMAIDSLYFEGTGTINTNANNINYLVFNANAFINQNSSFNHVTIRGNGTITGSNTFGNLELTQGKHYIFSGNTTQLFTGSLTANGTCAERIIFSSNSATIKANFSKTAGSVSVNYCLLSGINATGGASFSANQSIDLGNNSGWTITQPAPIDLYWIGGSGTWEDGNNWSLSSGGPAANCVPTKLDNVFFDANSFTAPGQVLTLIGDASGNVNVLNMNWTGAAHNPTLAGAAGVNLRIYGSMTLTSGISWNFLGQVYFEATEPGQTILSAGVALDKNHLYFNGAGGGWTLLDALNIGSRDIELVRGSLNTNNQQVNAGRLRSFNTSNTRSLTLGSSQIVLSSTSWTTVQINGTNMTLDAGTSLIRLTGAGAGFYNIGGGGLFFYDLICEAATGTVNIYNLNGGFNKIIFNSSTGNSLYYSNTVDSILFTSANWGEFRDGTFNINFVSFNANAIFSNVNNSTFGEIVFGGNAQFSGTGNTYGELNIPGTGTFSGDNNNYGNVSIAGNGTIGGNSTYDYLFIGGNGAIQGNNTIGTLEFAAGKQYTLTNTRTQTILNDFIANGTETELIIIRSSAAGNQTTISKASGTVTLNHVSLQDNNATGGAAFIANNSFDMGNNSGWIINAPGGKDYYWVGGSGNWNEPANWSLSSGGPGGAGIPSMLDNVFFDANSFTAPGQVLTLIGDASGNVNVLNMNWTGAAHNPTLAGAAGVNLRIYGSLTLTSGIAWNFLGRIYFEATEPGQTILSAGVSLDKNHLYFNGAGGGWTLLDALNIGSRDIQLVRGSLNTNNQQVNAGSLRSINTNVRTLTLGSSEIILSSTSSEAVWITGTNMSLDAGTSLIRLTGANAGFNNTSGGGLFFYDLICDAATGTANIANLNGGFNKIIFNSSTGSRLYYSNTVDSILFTSANWGEFRDGTFDINFVSFNANANFVNVSNSTFGEVIIGGTATLGGNNSYDNVSFGGDATVSGNNTFGSMVLTPGKTYTFTNGRTQTITQGIVANGTCYAPINIVSSSSTTQTSFYKEDGNITVSYASLQGINATGGALFTAENSIDQGNNSGWTFAEVPQNLYWVGGTGNWNDINRWAAESGGAGGYCLPTRLDHVIFDQNSFSQTGQAVWINVADAECRDMDWSNAAFAPTFTTTSASNNLKIYGSLTLSQQMNFAFTGIVYFEGKTPSNSSHLIKMAGKGFSNDVYFIGVGGIWTLQDALTITNNDLYLNHGELNTNSKTVSVRRFISTNNNIRSLNLGASHINIVSPLIQAWYVTGDNFTMNAGTSEIRLTTAGAGFHSTGNSSPNYYSVLFQNPGGTSTLRSNHTFNAVEFNPSGIIMDGGTYASVVMNNGGQLQNNGIYGLVKLYGNTTITGSNTFNRLLLGPGNAFVFQSGQAQTITGRFIIWGSAANNINIQSSTAGSQSTILKSTGEVLGNYINLKDMNAAGGAVFNLYSSVDLGNNTGWNFLAPTYEDLSGITISNNQTICYEATEVITIGGAEEFIVENGGSAKAIAGFKVSILPGTKVFSGGHFQAYVTPYGFFCDTISTMLASMPTETIEQELFTFKSGTEKLLTLFPNPTHGAFVLQLREAEELMVITVKIYNMIGERILQTQLSGQQQYEFDLSNRPGGVYLVRVVRGEEVGVEKVVKQ